MHVFRLSDFHTTLMFASDNDDKTLQSMDLMTRREIAHTSYQPIAGHLIKYFLCTIVGNGVVLLPSNLISIIKLPVPCYAHTRNIKDYEFDCWCPVTSSKSVDYKDLNVSQWLSEFWWLRLHFHQTNKINLTRCGVLTPYGVIDVGHHLSRC